MTKAVSILGKSSRVLTVVTPYVNGVNVGLTAANTVTAPRNDDGSYDVSGYVIVTCPQSPYQPKFHKSVHRAPLQPRQPLQRRLQSRILLGKAKAHHALVKAAAIKRR
jgi:hypothetical protein